jgi:membrane-associated protease RseP (regulator of RpoE activity)
VLPKTGFNTNAPPVEVFGGYLIRGDSKVENGDDLIDAIDASLAKSPQLRDKFTITYIKDITGVMGVSDVEFEQAMMTTLPRALYVMGPDVTRERNRLALTVTSALGIATSWYLSIYPFLLNPTFMKRAEEQVALADASMAYDLTWLTDLSIPLFATFLGLQLAHEAGHRVTAGIYGINVTLPTFVPSLASGITSSITNLKSPAKNREQLFDFAIAGPLTGIVGSLIALYAGLQLTVNSDPATIAMFPALPLEILRQSSLGGGMIEAVLGNGMLSIPDGAQGTQAIASMNVPLHPVALAGYISLIVNSLSLLPIGSKWEVHF